MTSREAEPPSGGHRRHPGGGHRRPLDGSRAFV